MRRLTLVLSSLVLVATLPARAAAPGGTCAATHAPRWAPATGKSVAGADIRVYAMQYKQEIANVTSYASFRRKIECMIDDLVLPTADLDGDGRADRPAIVVFNEDTGLATIATGTRGTAARAFAQYGPKDPANLTGAIGAFGLVGAAYQRSIAYYAAKFPETSAQRLILAAATDTFARGFMRTFSDLARAHNLYIVAANNQPEFRETSDPAAVAALADPDLAQSYATGALSSVYEGVDTPGDAGVGRAGIDVYNTAFMWSPDAGVTDYAAHRFAGEGLDGAAITATDPRANVVAVNVKTPITSIESQILDLSDNGDTSARNVGPFHLLPADDPESRIKIGFGISLPAFMWGSKFGVPFTGDPCASSQTWMRCIDAAGVNLFLQPEANPGMWAEYDDLGWKPAAFQSLSWLDSAWRAVADPTVKNIRYAVTPMMTGNLVDLTFDGQSSIFQRCVDATTCAANTPATHVGANEFDPCATDGQTRCDDPALKPYAFAKPETMAMAPWVLPDAPCPACANPLANREILAARSNAMQAGTGSPFENDYLETAIYADLTF